MIHYDHLFLSTHKALEFDSPSFHESVLHTSKL